MMENSQENEHPTEDTTEDTGQETSAPQVFLCNHPDSLCNRDLIGGAL